MIDVHKIKAFPAGSVMRTIMDHVATQRAELPSGVGLGPYAPPRPGDRTADIIAASLAGGMIAAGGKVVTAEEAVGVFREVRATLELHQKRSI